jgi:hypothetical protein
MNLPRNLCNDSTERTHKESKAYYAKFASDVKNCSWGTTQPTSPIGSASPTAKETEDYFAWFTRNAKEEECPKPYLKNGKPCRCPKWHTHDDETKTLPCQAGKKCYLHACNRKWEFTPMHGVGVIAIEPNKCNHFEDCNRDVCPFMHKSDQHFWEKRVCDINAPEQKTLVKKKQPIISVAKKDDSLTSKQFTFASVVEINGSPKTALTEVIQKPAPNEVIQKPAPTEVIQKTAPTEVIQEPASTEVIQKPAPTEVIQKPAPTEVIQKTASTEVIQKTAPTEEVNSSEIEKLRTENMDLKKQNMDLQQENINLNIKIFNDAKKKFERYQFEQSQQDRHQDHHPNRYQDRNQDHFRNPNRYQDLNQDHFRNPNRYQDLNQDHFRNPNRYQDLNQDQFRNQDQNPNQNQFQNSFQRNGRMPYN